MVELSNRDEKAKRETYRAVGGIRGRFNDDWNYELSANYGEFREKTRILGNVNLQRFLLAIDAVDAGVAAGVPRMATSSAVRRSIRRRASRSKQPATPPMRHRSWRPMSRPACRSTCSAKATSRQTRADYLLQDLLASGKITQFVASGFVSGDFSQLFELPGGPVGFAVGAEYRRETTNYVQDEATAAGLTFYNAIPPFSPPSFEVKEAYARNPRAADPRIRSSTNCRSAPPAASPITRVRRARSIRTTRASTSPPFAIFACAATIRAPFVHRT